MKLIVALGNPGREYYNTRHNLGFIMLDKYVEKKGLSAYKSKFNGLYTTDTINGEKVIYMKPQSYMNLSGGVVKKYMNFFNIDVDDILILCDDLDLATGTFKLKSVGSSGGHNGLKDIELQVKTKEYKRLKLGIMNNKNMSTKDYVLSNFSKEEKIVNDSVSEIVNDILDDYLIMDFVKLMNKYNRK